MSGLKERIQAEAASLSEGSLLSRGSLASLATPRALSRALVDLAGEGALLRVAPGLYVRPIETRFGRRAPAPEKVVESLAALRGLVITPTGAAAANALHLSTQVPARLVFLTSGSSRRLQLGRQLVELRHAPAWQLRPGLVGQALRALAWLGPHAAPEALPRLERLLGPEEMGALRRAAPRRPLWLARLLRGE